ncbi:MAG: hypothetical protein ACFFDN_23715, partial [Candidatus Hodarchaeota archaeon]
MSNRFINIIVDFIIDGLKNYLGEILLALTLFFVVLCRKLWWKLRDKQKLRTSIPLRFLRFSDMHLLMA